MKPSKARRISRTMISRCSTGLQARERQPHDPLHGPRQDDGRGPAVHFRRHFEDDQYAHDATVEDIMHAYMESWKLGLKAVGDLPRRIEANSATDTSRDKDEKKAEVAESNEARPLRRKLPDERGRSPTSSISRGMRGTSLPALTKTASPARSLSPCPKKARPSPV